MMSDDTRPRDSFAPSGPGTRLLWWGAKGIATVISRKFFGYKNRFEDASFQNQEILLKKYEASVDIDGILKVLPAELTFTHNISSFSEAADLKDDKNKPLLPGHLWDNLRDPQRNTAVSNALNPTFVDCKNKIEEINKKYQEDIAALHWLRKNDPAGTYTAHKYEMLAASTLSDALDALKDAHDKQKNEIEQKFADTTFADTFKTAADIRNNDELNKAKTQLLETLDKQYEEKKKKIEESFGAIILQREANRYTIYGLYHEDKKRGNQQIQKLQDEKQNYIGIDAEGLGYSYQNLKLEDLDELHSAAGTTITRKMENGHPVYSTKIPSRFDYFLCKSFFGNLIYSRTELIKLDAQKMVQAIRATGAETISLSIKHDNEEVAKETARIAFAEAVAAGYDPEKAVKIKINGQDVTIDDLYKDKLHKPELAYLKTAYQQILVHRKQQETDLIKREQNSSGEYRKQRQDITTSYKAALTQPQQQPGVNNNAPVPTLQSGG